MDRGFIITSTRTSAGKTTIALGIALNAGAKHIGYIKPFGDHMIYKKKVLCDADALLFHKVLGTSPPQLTLGFDYQKMSTEKKTALMKRLKQSFAEASAGAEFTIVESACNFSFGRMAGMDTLSLSEALELDVLLVSDGDPELVYDKVSVVSENCEGRGVRLRGLVLNKVDDSSMERMKDVGRRCEKEMGVRFLGAVPTDPVVGCLDVETLAEKLHAKVVAGASGLENVVKFVVVGAMSAESAVSHSIFHKPGKFLITGGDRVDFILLSLESSTAGLLLTNNVIPHSSILAKADEKGVPLLSIHNDTYTAAKLVERILPDVKPDDTEKIAAVREMVGRHVKVDIALGG